MGQGPWIGRFLVAGRGWEASDSQLMIKLAFCQRGPQYIVMGLRICIDAQIRPKSHDPQIPTYNSFPCFLSTSTAGHFGAIANVGGAGGGSLFLISCYICVE